MLDLDERIRDLEERQRELDTRIVSLDAQIVEAKRTETFASLSPLYDALGDALYDLGQIDARLLDAAGLKAGFDRSFSNLIAK